MQEYTTRKGVTIHTGQRYRDAHRIEPRTLVVTSIVAHDHWADVYLDVLDDNGQPIRNVRMTDERLTGRDFKPAQED